MLPEQTVYICGTSKSICSGLRVAYMVYSDAFHHKILQSIYTNNVKTSSLDAEVITELILSGVASKIANQKQQLAQMANEIYTNYFPEKKVGEHPLSFYRWLPIQTHLNTSQIETDLKNEGIRVFHSVRFMSGRTTKYHYLRIALSSTNTLDDLQRGLEILKYYVDKH
ncbi:hypothetical protein [Psychrobacillus soli]|uniref:hypothetical protein n=1 Tax=Psychrobacillus soli TaxID=1543965 RepID=UPI00163C3BD6|nr:hypothetical protein [Psychrobacillus soli]